MANFCCDFYTEKIKLKEDFAPVNFDLFLCKFRFRNKLHRSTELYTNPRSGLRNFIDDLSDQPTQKITLFAQLKISFKNIYIKWKK